MMRLPRIPHRDKLKPAWQYKTTGVLWRVYLAGKEEIVGEERDPERKTASFFCLNRYTGRRLWSGVTFKEGWWVGIEAIKGDIIYMHGFATPDLPEHKGITATDLRNGKMLWSRGDLRFLAASESSVFASKDSLSGPVFCEIDGRKGIVREEPGHELSAMRLSAAQKLDEPFDRMRLPIPLKNLLAEAPGLREVVQMHYRLDKMAGLPEALHQGAWVIINYHERTGESTPDGACLNNILKIVDRKTGALEFSDTLNQNAPAAAPDSFFMLDDMIYYVKEHMTLTAISLV